MSFLFIVSFKRQIETTEIKDINALVSKCKENNHRNKHGSAFSVFNY